MTTLFVICQVSIALWIISQLMILFSESKHQLWISYLIGNAGICSFAPLWLMFAAEYTESKSGVMRILPFTAVVMFAFIATNPIHGFYYRIFERESIQYGMLFYMFQVLFYIFIISGIILICRNKNHAHILPALATAIPLIVNIFTVSGITKPEIELTPLFFAFSVIIILIAIRYYGFLNITGIAINDTMNNIGIGVIIFGNDGNITYRNKLAESIMDSENISGMSDFENISSNDFESDGKFYNISRNICLNKKGEEIAKVIIISDVSEYYELAEAEKKLSVEYERNRIAQEIHDSAGHTFTMISSIARILQIEMDKEHISEYIIEIDGLARSGITQLRISINNLRDDEFMTSVTRAVQTVTNAVRNIKVETCFQGTEDERFSFCIREVYDNVRETLTNSMRYSGADRIDIIVKFLDERLELYIFDNGCGCEKINENNGLSGIRTRTEQLGGSVKFASVVGEGFTTIMKIPVNYTEGVK